MSKCSKITADGWLAFLGVIVGVIASTVIALIVLYLQNSSTEQLAAKLKYSEIIIEIVNDIGVCKKDILQLGPVKDKDYAQVAKGVLVNCRYKFKPALAGLKIIGKEFELDDSKGMYRDLVSLDTDFHNLILKLEIETGNTNYKAIDKLSDKVFHLVANNQDASKLTLDSFVFKTQ